MGPFLRRRVIDRTHRTTFYTLEHEPAFKESGAVDNPLMIVGAENGSAGLLRFADENVHINGLCTPPAWVVH